LISGPLRTPSLASQAPTAFGQNQNGDRLKHRIVSFAGKPRAN